MPHASVRRLILQEKNLITTIRGIVDFYYSLFCSFAVVATILKYSSRSSNFTEKRLTTRSRCRRFSGSSCCRTKTAGKCSSSFLSIRRSSRVRRDITISYCYLIRRKKRPSNFRSPSKMINFYRYIIFFLITRETLYGEMFSNF